jgi:hypothetical protein
MPSELNGARVDGRAAVLASFRDAVGMFDRRFDSRRLRLTHGPTIEDGRVITAVARYEREALAPLELVGEEWFTFEGDRIKHHVDQVVNATEVMGYLARHADAPAAAARQGPPRRRRRMIRRPRRSVRRADNPAESSRRHRRARSP